MWTEKYSPKGLSEFIGNHEIAEHVQKWAQSWNSGKKGKPLLLHGATGTGKTCLSLLTAKLNNWDIFELNASDFRTKEIIERIVGAASMGASFSGKLRLVLIDEVDGLQSQDRGGASSIAQILKESQNPVILTANDIYGDQKLAPIRGLCELLEFKKINYLSIAKRMGELLDMEKISYDDEAIKEFARKTEGDFRAGLLDLQVLSSDNEKITMEKIETLGWRERQENIFKIMKTIFKGNTLAEVRKAAMQSEVSDDLLLRWIEENIPRQYKAEDAARAFDALSRADIFNGRIYGRQYWGFKRYSSELMTSGVTFAREKDYHEYIAFAFPTLLRKLSSSKSLRLMKKQLGTKIGSKTHSSSREVMAYDLPYLKILFENKTLAAQFTAYFDLDEKEVAFLLETKPDTKKVQKIIEEAAELRKKEIILRRKPVSKFSEFTEPEEKETINIDSKNQTRLF